MISQKMIPDIGFDTGKDNPNQNLDHEDTKSDELILITKTRKVIKSNLPILIPLRDFVPSCFRDQFLSVALNSNAYHEDTKYKPYSFFRAFQLSCFRDDFSSKLVTGSRRLF
jgi:hypothetical protein